MSRQAPAAQAGFTLVEAIIVIVLTGIISAVVAVFITKPVQGYFDAARRAGLTDMADSALRRIGRDLHLALPNSVRLPTSPAANTSCLEFIPTLTGGRYRGQCSTQPCPAGQDELDFTSADASFEVIGGLNFTPSANDRVVIHNLGVAPADAYADASGNMAPIAAPLSTSKITLSPAKLFPSESPGNRFYVIPNSEQAVFYVCSGIGTDAAGNGTGVLYRYSAYGFNASNPATCPSSNQATTPVLARNLSACSFTYSPGLTQRNAVVSIRLSGTQAGETVTLYHEVHVSNIP